MQGLFCNLGLKMNDNNSLKKTKVNSSIVHIYIHIIYSLKVVVCIRCEIHSGSVTDCPLFSGTVIEPDTGDTLSNISASVPSELL